jgi:thioredoxin-like negative regulator of GroEL
VTTKNQINKLSMMARAMARSANWRVVEDCAKRILKLDKGSAEGQFLAGLAAKGSLRYERAEKSFRRALKQDAGRYDAGIELADLFVKLQRNSEALQLFDEFIPLLSNSPLYLEMTAQAFARLDLHERAWPLFVAACKLQPDVERFQAGRAASAVFIGKVDEARKIYAMLLKKRPDHQQFHYHLSQIAKAQDTGHIEQMKSVLASGNLPPPQNIFLYYALGKELEDLERWDEAFDYFKKGGDAASSVSGYQVRTDLELIDTVRTHCTAEWLRSGPAASDVSSIGRKPIFIVGLPRTGTTLTERIIGSHSSVHSIRETFFMQMALRHESGVKTNDSMNAEIIKAASARPAENIAARYYDAIQYKLGDEPVFIEKLPENYLYLGFIAKGMPDARIVHLRRHPMDACFAMFKQSYFRYAYTLDDVGRYYVAYDALMAHWRDVLGDRMVEVSYETLVNHQEPETRRLLERLGLDFEEACLNFEQNLAPSSTASAVQVRERMHTRSINRWKHFQTQLQPLSEHLKKHGIDVD